MVLVAGPSFSVTLSDEFIYVVVHPCGVVHHSILIGDMGKILLTSRMAAHLASRPPISRPFPASTGVLLKVWFYHCKQSSLSLFDQEEEEIHEEPQGPELPLGQP
ncbi:hypothetical protein PoB_000245000 [Plakobranchus ocellatus]|uniref:Uncharacterized protein n=1 Tax=Plakobranchus ocellatus TaxID=259542 RepID=A0AAV3XZ66_9GAST|nr:hypothetical protein PoB_000245000 [Plakobranchus ocellatus]